ncbi:SpvB/TcaC N-terminal domain-containing protein [Flavobacterium sp. 28YEA47A]|uniref:SpvB/TcaC N-terminal domain-containing protein n=1 Tax=Flavobacterium sp. 28YEA47A TaxID=3156276 RepID=UPI0035151437
MRNSLTVKVLFSSVLSNLVVFGQPLQEMVVSHLNMRNAAKANERNYQYDSRETASDEATTNAYNHAASPTHSKSEKTAAVFYATEKNGTIGKAFESEGENPYDNFFTVHIPDYIDTENYEATLVYELYGVADASHTTKSINGYPSYGGKIVSITNKWLPVREDLSTIQLKSGSNEIFFNRRVKETYQYKIKNLRIELKEKSAKVIHLNKTLLNFNGSLYLSGTVSSPEIKSVEIMGEIVPVNNGVFEYILNNASKDLKEVKVYYTGKDTKKNTASFPVVYQQNNAVYQFTESVLENTAKLYSMSDFASQPIVYNDIKINIENKQLLNGNGHLVIEGLKFKDIKTLNDDIENVTAGTYSAYRVKKRNILDSVPMQLHIKYDAKELPDGYTARDIKTFYFDKNHRSWKALEVDSLDLENEEIISTVYSSDTDYINGVIKVPDSPETGDFAPTMISDMKYANPAEGIVSIQPPSPNSVGTVTTSFPLKLPQGRNGMQPSLDVNYSSEGGNGWMGIGWGLSIPGISLNTKWGAPTFNGSYESELYSLNGADLVLKNGTTYTNPHRQATIAREGERVFYQRKEGSYQKIVRHGSNPSNYWWEVTDKTGNKTFYGGHTQTGLNTNAIITSNGLVGGNIAYWAITRVQDSYGNFIEYTYTKNEKQIGSSTVRGQEFYIDKIRYTQHANLSNYYEVDFKRNEYTTNLNDINNEIVVSNATVARKDVMVNARNGYIQIIDDVLTEVHISLFKQGEIDRIRSYRFDYEQKEFQKQQLVRISEFDTNGSVFYSNSLEYYKEHDYANTNIISTESTPWSGGNDNFSSPLQDLSGVTQGLVPNGSLLGTSVSSGYSFGLRAGVGIGLNVMSVGNSLGGTINYSQSNQDARISFMDLNGDGLPDKIFKNNEGIFYRYNTGNGFAEPLLVDGISKLNKTKSKTTGAGVDLNAGFKELASVGIGKNWSKTTSETDSYFTDFNGDGLPDLVKDGKVWFNKSQNGNDFMRKFEPSITFSENEITSGTVDPSLISSLNLQTLNEVREEHPQFDHVKVWQAPYQGTVNIESLATLIDKNVQDNKENTFRLTVERGTPQMGNSAEVLLTSNLINKNQTNTISYDGLAVNKGDKLFFRIHNKDYGYGGEIEWNPRIVYTNTSVLPLSTGNDDNGKKIHIYDAQQDFIINNDGMEQIKNGSITINYNLPSFTVLPTDDLRFIIKKKRINLEEGTETILNTWTVSYNHLNNDYSGGSAPFSDYISPPQGYKDVFFFYVESNSNVDWGAIKWKPFYTDSDSKIYYPGVDYMAFDDNINQARYWIDNDLLIEPVIDYPADAHTAFMQMSHNLFDHEPQLNELEDNQFPVQINWVTKGEIGGIVKVLNAKRFYVYKDINGNYFYTRSENPYHIVIPAVDSKFDISKQTIKDIVSSGGKIYSAFYINDTRLANNSVNISLKLHPDIGGYSFSGITLKRPFMAIKPQTYGITYRGWGQFLYNGGIKFQRDNQGNIPNLSDLTYFDGPIELNLFNETIQAGNGNINFDQDPNEMSIGDNAIRYIYYDSQNQNNKYASNTIVNGTYGYKDDKLTATLGRFGEGNLYDVYIDPQSLVSPGAGVFLGMRQISESKGTSVSGNVGIGILGANGTQSEATSNVITQYLDLNGDSYPDLITKGKIQYTNMLGMLLATSVDNTDHFVSGDDSNDFTAGATIACFKPSSTERAETDKKPKTSTPASTGAADSTAGATAGATGATGGSPAPTGGSTGSTASSPSTNSTNTNVTSGINKSEGTSQNSKLWADMNGDGLLDKVRVNKGSGIPGVADASVEVWLNTGYGFSDVIVWGSGYFYLIASSRKNSVSANPDFSVGKSFAFGFGSASSTANVNTMIIDVNGDGLPDLLISRDGKYSYYLNTGNGFDTEMKIFHDSDKAEEDKSISGNVFAAYTYGFGITFLNLKFVFTGSAAANASYNEKIRTIQDINGDGLPDVISRGSSTNNSNISVNLNTIGKTYLLKKVNTPLGGSWSVDYNRNGNTYDMPQSKWVVTKIETHDGFIDDNAYKTDKSLAVISYTNPKHDRREREFLGYGTVTLKQIDPAALGTAYRTVVKSYHNENYYLSGIEKGSIVYDQSGQKLSEEQKLFNLLDPDTPVVNMNATAETNFLQSNVIYNSNALLDQSRLLVAVAKTTSTSYEGSNKLEAVKEFVNYDNRGNLTIFIDKGEGVNDAYRSVIEYHASIPGLENSIGFPKNISVYKNSDNKLFRQRTASYNAYGKLEQITTKLNLNENNNVSFEYDTFGNLFKVNELDNKNAQGDHYVKTISYDDVVNTYPTDFGNSFGETSTTNYNYLFGIPVFTTDKNGQSMRTRIDNRGRIVEVTAPNELALETPANSAWTIRMEYKKEAPIIGKLHPTEYMLIAQNQFLAINPGGNQPVNSQHYAVTRHFDPEYAPLYSTESTNHLLTISIVDGFGEAVQLKKTHLSDNLKWMISGFETKDAFGRTLKSYLPAVENSYSPAGDPYNLQNATTYYAISPSSLPEPVEMAYDAKDRVTEIRQPGESLSSSISYGIEGNLFVQKTVNELSQRNDTYTDIRGRQRKTVQNGEITTKLEYNAINELTHVINNAGFITGNIYDLAGRKTEMQHPDRGVVTFKYDKSGNMIEQSNSNLLLAGGLKIKYDYDFGRLVKITYPQNPLNGVKYTYGSPNDATAVDGKAIGRLLYQEDATGIQVFGYGRMGEVISNLRSVAVAGYQSYWFLTEWKYDSWNRVQEITYPDREVVSYNYNIGGTLHSIDSKIDDIPDLKPILTSITYNDYGERNLIIHGNGTKTSYSYDIRRRMNMLSNDFVDFSITKNYEYDAISNITGIVTDQPHNSLPLSGQIGGPVNHTYTYDAYNRLITAKGNYTGSNDISTPFLRQEYELTMEYNLDHTIKKKTQSQRQLLTDGYNTPATHKAPVYKNSYILDYSDYGKGAFVAGNGYGYLQPHAPRTIIESPSWEGGLQPEDPRIKRKEVLYDANGNQLEIKEKVGELKTSLRKNLWDEENRLMGVNLKPDETTDHPIAVYSYSGGDRIIRYNMDRMDIFSNAKKAAQNSKDNIMIYPSGLLMGKVRHSFTGDRVDVMTYTKHYYVGNERISAKTGTCKEMGVYPGNFLPAAQLNISDSQIRALSTAKVDSAGIALTGIYTKFGLSNPDLVPVIEGEITKFYHDPNDLNTYYFHPDHLGSSSYITNAAGIVSQHMEYLPFGETLVDEHTNSFNSPFKFNGKELDEETGNYYYGARYYDPKWSIFVSVDPLAEQTMDAYGYCYNNPVNLVDPDGRQGEDWFKGAGGRVVWFDNKSKGFTDTNGSKWTNIGATTAQVQKNMNIPKSKIIKYNSIEAFGTLGEDGYKKPRATLNLVVFNNTTRVNYSMNVENTGADGKLISGKSEITGVNANARFTTETFAPGIQTNGVSGSFGVKEWTPMGKKFTFESTPFKDIGTPMLSNAPSHATSEASLFVPLKAFSRLTNSSSLNLKFDTKANTTNKASGDDIQFDISK